MCEIFQNKSFCGPNVNSCIERVSKRHSDCKISCTGLYAVVWYKKIDEELKKGKSGEKFAKITSAYHQYLNKYAENLVYNSSSGDLSKCLSEKVNFYHFHCFPVSLKERPPLDLVEIFFVPASFDQIERDRKLTLEAQLGLIGGTMGLLTGFSILRSHRLVDCYFILLFFYGLAQLGLLLTFHV